VTAPAPLPLWRLVQRTMVRDPWGWALAPVLAAIGFSLAGRTAEVAVVSLYGIAQLLVPPVVLAIAVPYLASRATWAMWSAMTPRPGGAFVAAATGAALGLTWPAVIGAAIAAAAAGVPLGPAAALVLAVAATVVMWTAVGAALSALTLAPARALAGGLAVWGLLVLAYEPVLVAVAVAAAEWPFEGPLALALVLNPAELGRVALVRALDVPVFAGPTGVLVRRWLGDLPLLWAVVSWSVWALALAWFAAVVFARRER
jgi:hypothetical protein